MPWDIEYTEQFETWWRSLDEDEQFGLAGVIQRLEAEGPALGRPHADRIAQSRHHNMKELRDRTLRVLFAFDPRRTAILLVGGNKSHDAPTTPSWNAWYDTYVPIADQRYDDHLAELRREGLP